MDQAGSTSGVGSSPIKCGLDGLRRLTAATYSKHDRILPYLRMFLVELEGIRKDQFDVVGKIKHCGIFSTFQRFLWGGEMNTIYMETQT